MEFHILNFFRIKDDFATTVEMNEDFRKSGLSTGGPGFQNVLDNNYLDVERRNNRPVYKINEYGIARWNRLNKEIEEQNQQTAPIIQHFQTHGPNSPIAARDVNMGDIKMNEENPESTELARKGLSVSKKTLLWTIIAVCITALGILIAVLISK